VSRRVIDELSLAQHHRQDESGLDASLGNVFWRLLKRIPWRLKEIQAK